MMKFFKLITLLSIALVPFTLNINADDSLKDLIAKEMNVTADKIYLKKLTKGMTSAKNYSFKLNNKKYIVKIFSKKQKQNSRNRELEIAKIFSDLKLGAKLIAATDTFYIREYIPGKTIKYKDIQDDKVLVSLAQALKKLHSYKSSIDSRNQMSRLEKHLKKIAKKQVVLPRDFNKSLDRYKENSKKLMVSMGFCHNDLNPHNIVISEDNVIHFIDFGNAGNNNIYEDLGYITKLNGISGEKMKIFLKEYFGREPKKEELDAVILSQKQVSLLTAVVYFDFSESKKEKETKIDDRIRNLDNLKDKIVKTADDFIKDSKPVHVKSKNKELVKEYAVAFYKEFCCP